MEETTGHEDGLADGRAVVLEGRSNEVDNLPTKSIRSMYDVQENSVRMEAALLLGIGRRKSVSCRYHDVVFMMLWCLLVGGRGSMTYDVHVPDHLGISTKLSAKLEKARETNTPTYSKIN